ncbi:MAG: hypothetical protein UU25_C0029G0003 [Microgenomates group bacterium GW2011_GWB1_40_9]|nr:MAG: hypothetical protein UU25_C0029G0003 [Microgenomates group bacterium GW2011_GWB1_40_9]
MKTIVTHFAPDLDGITSIWLLKTFLPEWKEAAIAFVPAGKTLQDTPVDSDLEVVHVDTGFGKFDHHQSNEDTCAALLVYESLGKKDEALERLLRVVNDVDHFREVFFPSPMSDVWDLSLGSIIDGMNMTMVNDPLSMIDGVMDCMDASYKIFQNKVWAEKEIKEKGVEFTTQFGKSLGIETVNREAVHVGQKMGYVIVVRKDPKIGSIQIKSIPKDEIDLTALYDEMRKLDPDATWFLHASKHMLLNGSAKNPDMKPTKLILNEVIEIVKKIYG